MNGGNAGEQLEPTAQAPGSAWGAVGDDDHVEVIVVGAGQAGLAIGFFVARQGRRFLILEAADSVGVAWRDRWDSLALFTRRRYDAFPPVGFPGDPAGYPTRDEVVLNRPGCRARSDSTEGWGHASTEEVSGRAA